MFCTAPVLEGEALLGLCPMHIVTIAKDGNGRYRSPTVSRPYRAIVVRRRLRSLRTRERIFDKRKSPMRVQDLCMNQDTCHPGVIKITLLATRELKCMAAASIGGFPLYSTVSNILRRE